MPNCTATIPARTVSWRIYRALRRLRLTRREAASALWRGAHVEVVAI